LILKKILKSLPPDFKAKMHQIRRGGGSEGKGKGRGKGKEGEEKGREGEKDLLTAFWTNPAANVLKISV